MSSLISRISTWEKLSSIMMEIFRGRKNESVGHVLNSIKAKGIGKSY